MLRTNFPDHQLDEGYTGSVERRYLKAKSSRDELAAKVEAACHVSSLAKRAVLSVELNYFRTERVLRIATFLQEFTDVHAQFGETTSALWGGIGTVGSFPMSAMEHLQILQQQPLAKQSRSLYAVLPPKPPITAPRMAMQQQQQQRATTTTTTTSRAAEQQEEEETQPRSTKLQVVQDEEKHPLPQQQRLLEGAPTMTTKEGVTQESKEAVDDMTLAQARAIIAKYKYGGAEIAKRDEEPEQQQISRPMPMPNKYAGMYKKRVTPGKRLNRDVQIEHEFEAENPDELSVRRGEILKGLRFADEDTSQWLIVENSQGRRGIVPVSFVSVFSSSDEEEEEEKVSRPRARRISTASASTAATSVNNEPSGWQWQQQQQQPDNEWRRENEDLRNQLQEMRTEMQSLKSGRSSQGQQQQEPEQEQQQLPPLQAPPQKAFWVQSSAIQGTDRGRFTEGNATAMGEAFQKGSTGVAPRFQQPPQQQQQQQQQRQRPVVMGAAVVQQQPQQQQQPPQQQQQQQQQETTRRDPAQGEEDSWVQESKAQPAMMTTGATSIPTQQQEDQQPSPQNKSEKKRTGVLRWILGSGDKDKSQSSSSSSSSQQQQQQQQEEDQGHIPPTTAPGEEHEMEEEEEGKREESTSGEGGRTAALYVNKPPLEGGGKTDYAPAPSSTIQSVEQQPESSSSFAGAADEAANWVQGFDPKYQRNFYFNTRTKESTWSKPASWRAGGKTSATSLAEQPAATTTTA